jgi:hypothetical protein
MMKAFALEALFHLGLMTVAVPLFYETSSFLAGVLANWMG